MREDLLGLFNIPLNELIFKSNSLRINMRPKRIHRCAIMNVKSGGCSEDCAFCAQSRHYKTHAKVYGIKGKDEVIEMANRAKESGADCFSLVASGRGPNDREIDTYASLIYEIKKSVDINVCASLGIIDEKKLEILKDAGLGTYHHNIETSGRNFPRIVSTHTYEERLETLRCVKGVGLRLCSGFVLNIGEDIEDVISMIEVLKLYEVDSIPVNVLIPIKGTPLGDRRELNLLYILKVICVLRISFPERLIILAGGREACLGDFQTLALWAGIDGIMIGGYLTTGGNEVTKDNWLIEEFLRLI